MQPTESQCPICAYIDAAQPVNPAPHICLAPEDGDHLGALKGMKKGITDLLSLSAEHKNFLIAFRDHVKSDLGTGINIPDRQEFIDPPHKSYGPCDAFGEGGWCSMCRLEQIECNALLSRIQTLIDIACGDCKDMPVCGDGPGDPKGNDVSPTVAASRKKKRSTARSEPAPQNCADRRMYIQDSQLHVKG